MNAQKVCEQIIDYLIKDGFMLELHEEDLKRAIMYVRNCVDERTMERWKNALLTFQYIIMRAPKIYRLNPIKTPKIISLLKEQPQTKIR